MSARVGISLIGTPDGFEAASTGASRSLNVGRKVDLDNSVINILPDTDILAVRRDVEGGRLLTHVTYYRFAREIKTSRTGSFYGCSMLFENFVPSRIPFVLKMLEALADRVGDFCIDRSENRFHSHIGPALLEEVAADAGLLDATTYADGALLPPGRVHDGRCFLLVDRDVPNYAAFLSRALLDDPQSPSGLPSYHFVYTSKHAAVLEQVRLRRGLMVETLASLKGRHVGDGLARKMLEQAGPRPAREGGLSEAPPPAAPRAPAPGHVPASRAAESPGEPAPSPPAASAPPPLPTTRHAAAGAGSKIEIPVKYRPRSRARESEAARSDGRLVTLARLIEQSFRSRAAGAGLGGAKPAKVALVAAAAFAVAGFLGVYLFRGGITGGWGGSARTVFYYGCVNAAGGAAQATQKCMPDKVAEDFMTRLGDCQQFREHLDRLNQDDSKGGDRYREDYKKRIELSMTSGQTGDGSGTNNTSSLSSANPTSFEVPLDFKGSHICLDQILNGGDPDFKADPPAPAPTATATPKLTTTPAKAEGSGGDRPSDPPPNRNANVNRNANRNANANAGQTPNLNQAPTPTPSARDANSSNTARATPTPGDGKKQNTQQPSTTGTPQPGPQPQTTPPPLKLGKKGDRAPDANNQ